MPKMRMVPIAMPSLVPVGREDGLGEEAGGRVVEGCGVLVVGEGEDASEEVADCGDDVKVEVADDAVEVVPIKGGFMEVLPCNS
jgi:hypothetical protein